MVMDEGYGASAPTPAGRLPQTTITDIAWALCNLELLLPRYRLYAEYYHGIHRLAFATAKWRNAFGDLFRVLALNLMPAVCSAIADVLQIEGFAVEDAPATLVTDADELWHLNRMDLRAGEVHLEAIKTGDAYVIVWPDPETGVPMIYPNKAHQCLVRYDEEVPGRVVFAAKVWQRHDKRTRLNLYYPDRIEKYVTRQKTHGDLPHAAGIFEPFVDDGPDILANPWGVVPVFHFGNDAELGALGRSELHDVLPIQDMLNKTASDWMIAQEFQAYRQRWATGVDIPVDTDPDSATFGQPKLGAYQPGVDRFWVSGNPDARFGEFGEINLTQLVEAATEAAMWVSRVTGTPMHYFHLTTGEFPSGESQRRAEGRLIKKVRDRQGSFGAVWADVMALALRMWGKTDAAVRLKTQWVDMTPHSEKEDAEIEKLEWETAVIKHTLGVPKRRLLIEAGYDEDEVDEMEAERAAEDEAALEAAERAFNAGAGGG